MERLAPSTGVSAITRTFEDFYRRQFTRVYRATWLLARNEEDALDATQEAFGRAFARWRRLRRHDWAAGWVITTALNIARRHGRPVAAAPARNLDLRETSSDAVDLQRALQTLPRRQREALVLFYVGDLTIRGVADAMEISEGTVKAHLAQGRNALRERLEVRHV